MLKSAIAAASLLAASHAAIAAMPETGFWWNAQESGRGFAIEVQDNYLFFSGYIYDSAGNPTWYTTQGFVASNGNFTGSLTTGRGGQCINCNYTAPVFQIGGGGPIELSFATPVTGTMKWGNPVRTVPIRRFDYYYTRTVNDQQSDLLRGEWQMTLDYSQVQSTSGAALATYYGDALVFNAVDRSRTTAIVSGCRAPSSNNAMCGNSPRVATAYLSGTDTHVMSVDNDQTTQVAYAVRVDYQTLSGFAKVCNKSVTAATCLNSTAPSIPVKGFRSKPFSAITNSVTLTPGQMTPSEKSSRNTSLDTGLPSALGTGMSAREIEAAYGISPLDVGEPRLR